MVPHVFTTVVKTKFFMRDKAGVLGLEINSGGFERPLTQDYRVRNGYIGGTNPVVVQSKKM